MARFLLWSDLHDEMWNELPKIPDSARHVDALLLAGDTSTKGRHVDRALELYEELEKPVVMIRGNHEFYNSSIEEIITEDRARIDELNKQGKDIRLLDGEATEIGGTRIIGATLWTDLDLYPAQAPLARVSLLKGMNDFYQIKKTKNGAKFDLEKWLEMHNKDRKAILDLLAQHYDGPTLVMTHHIPTERMIHPDRQIGFSRDFLLNIGFACEMSQDVRKFPIDSWVCGHSHDNMQSEMNGASGIFPVYSNARGYSRERHLGRDFDPEFIVETWPVSRYPDPS